MSPETAPPKSRPSSGKSPLPHFLDFSHSDLETDFLSHLAQPYRLRQVCDWVFGRRAAAFAEMSNLPADLRGWLEKKYALRRLETARADKSKDGTVKLSFRTPREEPFSAVFLPHGHYHTLCISTQVGCAWKCSFCASGLVPFQRNLSSGEILDQLFLAETQTGKKIENVLFMGMGEPLANYAGTVQTLRWLTSNPGFGMNPARVTLSTTGLAPQIRKLAAEKLKVNLALSLHAATDELRRRIMPVSAKFKIDDVLKACKIYQTANGADFTIEYILLKDVNDHKQDAARLAHLLLGMKFSPRPKINLIPYNPVGGLRYRAPEPTRCEAFFRLLHDCGFNVHTRKPQGQDIEAACGQLL